MSDEIPSSLRNVQRASRSLRRLFMLIFALTLLGTLAVLFGQRPSIRLAGIAFEGEAVTTRIRVIWIVGTVLYAAVALKTLFHLVRLFGLYAEGKIFTRDNVAQIRQLGITLLLAPAVWLLVLLAAAPEISNLQEQWARLMPSFPGGQLVGGAIIQLVAWIMDAGRQLREEHDLVV